MLVALIQPAFPVAQWPLMAEYSLSQLRVSGGMGTFSSMNCRFRHPTSFEVYVYTVSSFRKDVKRNIYKYF